MAAREKKYQRLAEVFENPTMHLAVARIIQEHSTNPQDVRLFALEGLSLQSRQDILDVGCGFGFFTLALKGRVKKGAKIQGIDRFVSYREPYLNSCVMAGLKGRFSGSGVKSIGSLPSESFDLVLCSYGLYFFPEIIPELSRILKPEGVFVTITHAENHTKELISFVKEIYKTLEIRAPRILPCEKLVSNFSDKNGKPLLSRWFEQVKQKEYISSLVFNSDSFKNLKTYLLFKRPFFIPEEVEDKDSVFDEIIIRLRRKLEPEFRITKNDSIFVCEKPLKNKSNHVEEKTGLLPLLQ